MNPELSSPAFDLYGTILLYVSLICLAHMIFTKGRYMRRTGASELNHWGIGGLDFGLILFFLYLFAFGAGALTMGLFTLFSDYQTLPQSHQFIFQAYSMHLAFLIGLIGLNNWYPKTNSVKLSPAKGGLVPLPFRSIYLLLAFIPILVGIHHLWPIILQSLNLPTEPQEVVLQVTEMRSFPAVLTVGFLVVVLVPISEELLFRGFIYRNLKAFFPGWWPIILSSLIFAGMHFNWLSLLPLFLLGVWLCLAYEKTGNILAPIIIHGLFNANTLMLILLAEG